MAICCKHETFYVFFNVYWPEILHSFGRGRSALTNHLIKYQISGNYTSCVSSRSQNINKFDSRLLEEISFSNLYHIFDITNIDHMGHCPALLLHTFIVLGIPFTDSIRLIYLSKLNFAMNRRN